MAHSVTSDLHNAHQVDLHYSDLSLIVHDATICLHNVQGQIISKISLYDPGRYNSNAIFELHFNTIELTDLDLVTELLFSIAVGWTWVPKQ